MNTALKPEIESRPLFLPIVKYFYIMSNSMRSEPTLTVHISRAIVCASVLLLFGARSTLADQDEVQQAAPETRRLLVVARGAATKPIGELDRKLLEERRQRKTLEDEILKGLADEDEYVRATACYLAGIHKITRAIPVLTPMLGETLQPRIVKGTFPAISDTPALDALCEIGGFEAAIAMLNTLEKPISDDVRSRAVHVLTKVLEPDLAIVVIRHQLASPALTEPARENLESAIAAIKTLENKRDMSK